ncbi:MAG: hypothetical protein AB1673_06810 [Actinomycetota bacterium]
MNLPSGRSAEVARALGVVLLVPVSLFYLASGLVVPMPWLVAVWALGVAAVAYAIVNRRHRWRVAATPVVSFALWVVVLSLGDALLGWTA